MAGCIMVHISADLEYTLLARQWCKGLGFHTGLLKGPGIACLSSTLEAKKEWTPAQRMFNMGSRIAGSITIGLGSFVSTYNKPIIGDLVLNRVPFRAPDSYLGI